MNIPRGSTVGASHDPRAELTVRFQEIHVVGTDEILGQTDDGRLERGFSVVISGCFAHISRELGDLDLFVQVSLETRIQDFTLARFQAIVQGSDRAKGIAIREVNQFLVNELDCYVLFFHDDNLFLLVLRYKFESLVNHHHLIEPCNMVQQNHVLTY